MLEVEGIHTFYGMSHILFDVSLKVKQGQVVCVLGRNGAGKTTTLRSIMGLVPPIRGRVRLNDDHDRGLEINPCGSAGRYPHEDACAPCPREARA